MMTDLWLYLKEEAAGEDIQLSDRQIGQFRMFYEYLVEKNKVMNLTAITELPEVIRKHFLDSLLLVRVHTPQKEEKILDLGTGAGFPGIPLKIAFPDTEFILADSLRKRINFIDEVIEQCSLTGIETVHGRAEDLAQDPRWREQFDVCVSRAVAGLPVLSEYCLPFVKEKGCFITYKSETIDTEIQESSAALRILGGKIETCEKYNLPGSDEKRSLTVIRKIHATPKKYPRKAGTPSKVPLK